MKDFKYWNNLHQNENLEEFSMNRIGLLWLKTKSIIRKELIDGFIRQNNIALKQTSLKQQFAELFDFLKQDIDKSHKLLDSYIRTISNQQIKNIDIQQLVSELYKLRNFQWGGDYQNSLDKFLVSRYVKNQNPSFDYLISKFETEINPAVQGYVLNSWYNYWSSVLIENIFKSHPIILPTVGQIKSVDFFVSDIPFDLKVTYLPAEYIKKGLPLELTFLKQKAKEANIPYDKSAKPTDIFYEITEKMRDKNDALCTQILQKLKSCESRVENSQFNVKLICL